MIDYQNLPSNAQVDWFMQPTSGSEVHTWTKPSGCNFVYMIAVGGGGGGGYGGIAATGASRTAGGGGASGCITTLIVPAHLISDSLFIRVGIGGRGATNVTITGGAGTATVISAYSLTSGTEEYLFANGGNGGTVNSGGTTTTPAITNSTLATIGKWQGVASIAGVNGGSGGVPGNNNTLNYYLTGGGSGAGAISSNLPGGSIVSAYKQVSAVTVVQGGAAIADATQGQNDGQDGYFIPKRFISYGGGGGGSSTNGVAGRGGNGGPGSGGGGQGTGAVYINGYTAGGNGGDGFAVIISY
jgi:hypothetical protein